MDKKDILIKAMADAWNLMPQQEHEISVEDIAAEIPECTGTVRQHIGRKLLGLYRDKKLTRRRLPGRSYAYSLAEGVEYQDVINAVTGK